MGLTAIVGIVLSFVIQANMFAKKEARDLIERYQSTLGQMNNAAVEYTRGIIVVKVFGRLWNPLRNFVLVYKPIRIQLSNIP